jgi:hypothetical protein
LREQEENKHRGKVKEKSAAKPKKRALKQRGDVQAVQQVPEVEEAEHKYQQRLDGA